jgi:uncharacterized protein DUF1579
MTRKKAVVLTMIALLCTAGRLAGAQEMPPMPKPGPEHEILKSEAGTWDAKIEMMSPNGTMTSSGVETARVGCGGLCLITDFKGEMMPGMSFEGHGTSVYDSTKKKYVGTWADSMSQGLMISEGTWDPAAKTMTSMMEGPDMTGAIVKMKGVVEHKDANTRVFTMYNPDGAVGMKITYTRKQ